MNDPPMRGESGLHFAPQPYPPGLLGQRHVESTLFDLRQLDIARRLARKRGAYERSGSGLIDVKTLLGVAQDGELPARALVLPPRRGLVAIVERGESIPPASNLALRRVLVATCFALLVVTVMLAIEAIG